MFHFTPQHIANINEARRRYYGEESDEEDEEDYVASIQRVVDNYITWITYYLVMIAIFIKNLIRWIKNTE